MQVKLQECGCIALPDEVVSAMGLSAGAVFDVAYTRETLTLQAAERIPGAPAFRPGAACPTGEHRR